MKALKDMNNLEKAHLLAKLFPENLKELTLFVQQQTEYFKDKETYFRSIWAERSLLTADFWYMLVENVHRAIRSDAASLHKSSRVFADQLFDGYNAIFLIHCLVEYTEQVKTDPKLNEAIRFLFNSEKVIAIKTEPTEASDH